MNNLMTKVQQPGKNILRHRFLYKKIESLYQKPTRTSTLERK